MVSGDTDFKGVSDQDIVDKLNGLDFGDLKTPDSLNLILQSREDMYALNKQFRGVDSPTDVISFDSVDGLAEIYICPAYILDNVMKQCSADLINKRLFLKEFLRNILHGILHIGGLDHEIEFMGGYDLNPELSVDDQAMYHLQERLLIQLYEMIV